jgi:hypothetical protein
MRVTAPRRRSPTDIDLDGEGGLVWAKSRNATEWHSLCDTARGVNSQLFSNATNAASASGVTQFNSNGYATTGSQSNLGSTNYVSWTFRKAPKFFDVVTYTGTGANRTVSHNLGSVPGCIIVKRTDTTGDWQVYHRDNTASPETDYLVLNSTAATADSNTTLQQTLQPPDAVCKPWHRKFSRKRLRLAINTSPTYSPTMTVGLGMTVSRMWFRVGLLRLMERVRLAISLWDMNLNGFF